MGPSDSSAMFSSLEISEHDVKTSLTRSARSSAPSSFNLCPANCKQYHAFSMFNHHYRSNLKVATHFHIPVKVVSHIVLCAMPSEDVVRLAFCARTSSPLSTQASTRRSPG